MLRGSFRAILDQFKQAWLYRMGYTPAVTAATEYNESTKQFSIQFIQDSDAHETPFHLPIELALIDQRGETISGTEKVFLKSKKKQRT